MDIHLPIIFGILALSIMFLQRNFSTMTEIHENISRLFSKDVEPGSLELLLVFYMIFVPISFNTLLICALGKYTLESRRSMTRCYVYSSMMAMLALLISYFECSVYSNVVDGSLVFFNSVESGSLFLTNLNFTALLFKSEIDELKRINKVKKLGMCLVLPNIRIFVLVTGYFLWFMGIVAYLWYRTWLLRLCLAKAMLASVLFSSNSSLLTNYLYSVKTRIP